ncbi:hypothetical protein COP2_013402 [Malus domestica]
MIFIRRHIHDALQTEYLAEEDPRALWVSLADHFDHQKDIFLPEARHDWQHLRFQDFKSMNGYNYEVCRIRSLLKKTYSTIFASNIVLQQQYRAQKFTKFFYLISVLLLAEKQNQPVMKNHQVRPTRVTAVPEAHYSNHQRPKRQMGRDRGGHKPSYQG